MIKRGLHIVWLTILLTACGKQTQQDHSDHSGQGNKDSIGLVSRPVNQVVLSSQKTIKPLRGSNAKTIITNGYITFDERRNNKVAARISGRIEKLYVKYDYQYVKRGQRIAELYSPELSTYQEEYLFLLKASEDSLAQKAEEKLKLLGLSESQILKIKNSGIVAHTISIASPINGFVRFSTAPVSSQEMNSSASAMGSMAGVSSPRNDISATSAAQIQEGIYVTKGQTLFVVNDCEKVFAILSFDIASQANIKKGDAVILHSEVQEKETLARVDLIEPIYVEDQRFTQVQIYLDNLNRAFKINSLIKAEFPTHSNVLTVPASAVFDLGTRKIVWVRTHITKEGIGLFEPRVVTTGLSSNNSITILDGLEGNEDIALDAGYMIDREGIVNEKP